MDITQALAPASDQIDAVELVEPRTFTIDTGSRLGKRDGKTVAEIRLVEVDRVWRPSKGMLDVLAACWGTKADQWVGRRVTVYNDPDVMFGKEKVGGVRISHLSDIDAARDVQIRGAGATGRKRSWHVEPLTTPKDTSGRDWLTELATAAQIDKNAVASLGTAAKTAHASKVIIDMISTAWRELDAAEKAGNA